MTVTDVNQLVQRFEQAAKMMKTVARGGVPQIPGMGPVGYGGGKKQVQQKKKGGSKSGNPAKRAAENKALAEGRSLKPQSAGGAGFGVGRGGDGQPSPEELEKLSKLLGR
jgi:signal recognition particle subunit SRP54